MDVNTIKPYDEMCAVAFAISRMHHSVRQRQTVAGDEMEYGKSDATRIVLAIFNHGCREATNQETKSWCGHGHENLLAVSPRIMDSQRDFPQSIAFYEQASELAKRGIKLIVDNQDKVEHVRRFVFLLLSSCLGHGMMYILDDIASSLQAHPYFEDLDGSFEKQVIRLGGPGQIEGREESKDEEFGFAYAGSGLDINTSFPPWPFEEGANMNAVKEKIRFVSKEGLQRRQRNTASVSESEGVLRKLQNRFRNPLSSSDKRSVLGRCRDLFQCFFRSPCTEGHAHIERDLTHIIHIHYEGSMQSVVGVLPRGIDIRRPIWPNATSPDFEGAEVPISDQQAANVENRPAEDQSIPLQSVITSDPPSGSYAREENRSPDTPLESAPQSSSNRATEIEDVDISGDTRENVSADQARPHGAEGEGMGTSSQFIIDLLMPTIMSMPGPDQSPIQDGATHTVDLTETFRRLLSEQMNAQAESREATEPRENIGSSIPIEPQQTTEGSRSPPDDVPAHVYEERARPWTKLVAVLHVLDPVMVDDALVYTEKEIALKDCRVQKTGLVNGLASHDACIAQERVLRRLLKLEADEEGAKRRLPLAFPIGLYIYLLVTLGLAIAAAATDVAKRTSWFARATDFVTIVSIFWLSMFAILSVIVLDNNVLRNLALGRRVFRSADQVYAYTGKPVAVRTAIARHTGLFPWLKNVDMGFARSYLNGNIALRGGLSARQLQHAGWVYLRYVGILLT